MEFEALQAFLNTHWGWATGLAASVVATLVGALSLLNPERKEDLALWLLGAPSDLDWSRRFCALFDAVFGKNHLSLRCFLRSAVASLLSVVIIWMLMGNAGTLGIRIRETVTLEKALLIAICVNVLADYVSLLQTRLLIGNLHRLRHPVWHVLVLIVDLLLSAAIIWAALWLFVRSPLYGGGSSSFVETLGMFSILSVFFYSTFFTSVWSWVFVLSTWLLRVLRLTNMGHWLDIEKKPIPILGLIVGAVVFLGAMTFAAPLRQGEDGLSPVDTALCATFEGRICTRVASLSTDEQTELALLLRACTTGDAGECLLQGLDARRDRELPFYTDRQATLLGYACEGKIALACQMEMMVRLYLRRKSDDLPTNAQDEYAAMRQLAREIDAPNMASRIRATCEAGDPAGCAEAAIHYLPLEPALAACENENRSSACLVVVQRDLIGDGAPDEDLSRALDLMGQSCDGGYAPGCMMLAWTHLDGVFVAPDLEVVFDAFSSACEFGDGAGCTRLATVLVNPDLSVTYSDEGRGAMDPNAVVLNLFRMGCWGGDPEACTWIGTAHADGRFSSPDFELARMYYSYACTHDHAQGCMNLADLKNATIFDSHSAENQEAQQACNLGAENACAHLIWGEADGKPLRGEMRAISNLAYKACTLDLEVGCARFDAIRKLGPPHLIPRTAYLSFPLVEHRFSLP